jgi:putative phosphoesterase
MLLVRVGILSDTHDQVARTQAAVARLADAGAQVLIHCGDITIPDVVYELNPLPSYFVFGNCDDDLFNLRQAIAAVGGTSLERGGLIELAGRRLAVTHGDSDLELRRLEAQEPHYLLTGHTHQVADRRNGSIRWINPGALHRASTWTVALLDLESNQLRVLPISNGTTPR